MQIKTTQILIYQTGRNPKVWGWGYEEKSMLPFVGGMEYSSVDGKKRQHLWKQQLHRPAVHYQNSIEKNFPLAIQHE